MLFYEIKVSILPKGKRLRYDVAFKLKVVKWLLSLTTVMQQEFIIT